VPAFLLVHLAAAAEARQVLVLYSNNRLLTANVEFDAALRQTINANSGEPIQIFSEFLDGPAFGGNRYELTMATYLRDKYAERPPDAVLIVADTAFRFILRYRDRLFPAVPIVHAGVTRGTHLVIRDNHSSSEALIRWSGTSCRHGAARPGP
jgi:hypothetical protein